MSAITFLQSAMTSQVKREISENPAKNAVIDPVNKQNKDADVERKIKFYSVIQAFSANKYPSNAQINQTLDYVLTHSPIDQDQLSPDGRILIEDIRKIIATAQNLVQSKNSDELIQQWLHGTRQSLDVKDHTENIKASVGQAKDVAPPDEKRKEDGQQAIQHIRTLFQLILTNSEVRKLLSDSGIVGRDLLARGASKAARQLAPPQHKLAQVDDTAPRDEFVQDEKVDKLLSGRAFGKTKESKEEIKRETQEIQNEITEIEANDNLSEGAKEEKKKSLKDRLQRLQLSPENRERLDQHTNRAKTFLMEEYFPKERRDQWIYRLKKVIIECQKHEDYQESLRWLLGAVEEYAKYGRDAFTTADTKSLSSDPALRTSLSQLRTILERFANGKSLDGVINALDSLSQSAREDEELRAWFKDIDGYARKILLDTGYVLEPVCNKRGKEIRESGKQFYDVKYRAQFDGLFRAVQDWFTGMSEDPANVAFGEAWARLTKDLLFDESGSFKFKKHLWEDVRSTILPQLADKIGYVPIPRIEYTDPQIDLVVENLVLSGRNLFPNVVTLEAHNYVKFSPYKAIKDEHRHEIKLGLGQIQADMRDVAFYFRKKTGLVKTKDSGIADVLLGGSGVTATVHIASSPENDESSVFRVKSCVVKVDALKFSIRDSKHDFLYKTIKPLIAGLIKKQIQNAIADALVTGLQYVDGQLIGVRMRMKEAKLKAKAEAEALAADSDGASQASETSALKAWREAFKRPNAADGSSEAGDVSMKANKRSSSQFKVVNDKRKSLLSHEGHPSGWVNRTTERKELASQGEGWGSPVFDIVNDHDSKVGGINGINGAVPKTSAVSA
ncbi:hypothetical protein DL96DRAFT_1605435 [Flagelloscypha sp. PMI_526]|nr:hypothetical protein DL96DRAFT_1605435 [Flagelloscypha sp. PMI_526]